MSGPAMKSICQAMPQAVQVLVEMGSGLRLRRARRAPLERIDVDAGFSLGLRIALG